MTALILVDLQVDFLPGGSLAVPLGDDTIAVANRLLSSRERRFGLVVATQDWHPRNHGSFASQNGRPVGSLAELDGLPQVMWPDHCVQNTRGADLAPGLLLSRIDQVVQKGSDPKVDSYSGFFDNGRRRATGLTEILRSKDIKSLVIMGLATDYCVKFTVLDALSEGFSVTLVSDGCRAVNLKPQDGAEAIDAMRRAGAQIVESSSLV
jgi:nicotinamidase/pyrazinamidase